MTDEHGLQLFRQASACEHGVVIRGGVIVPFFYFTKIFNSRAFTELNLQDNQITDISALGNALNTNSTLTELKLHLNQITSEDREVLRTAWKHSADNLKL